jgi:hypothetical protein
MMLPISRRLVLRYDQGQFTFRHFSEVPDQATNNANLYNLAMQLNAFQTDPVETVLHVTAYQFGLLD